MKLTELEPKFVKMESESIWRTDAAISDCDGIEFLCPKCFAENNGPVGTHMIICWKPHIPQTIYPAPGRWNFEGASLDDLSLVAGSSSVALLSGCKAHFFVTNGEIRNC